MGKLGRIACIATPMVLSIASLICLLLVFLGGLNKNDPNLRQLYYFTADTSNFKANATDIINTVKGVDENTKKLIQGLLGQIQANNLKDLYYIYMWNHCTGAKKNGIANLDFCSPRKAQYYFNPIQEWGLNGTATQQYIPKAIDSAMGAYQKGASWMFIAYTIAFWATAATIIVGLFAICSRVGSCITTIVQGVATLFTVLAATTSTILFSTLVGALTATLKPYNIKLYLGTKMLAVQWIAVAFSLGASLFWLVSICCCSGRSNRKDNRKSQAAAGNYNTPFGSRGYQPLGEEHGTTGGAHAPYGGQGSRTMEMQNFGQAGAGPYKGRDTAYEPFRHT